jgi:PelA/Pel-15E family pectate lyase
MRHRLIVLVCSVWVLVWVGGKSLVTAQHSVAAAQQGAAPTITWGTELLRRESQWYASTQARGVADSVIQYQSPQGGWPKDTNLAVLPRSATDVPQSDDGRANTIDNDATTTPMAFLALVIDASDDAKYKSSFERGLDYLFQSQYPNGGWPQFYPLRDGYYSRITFNDDAMVHVLTLLRDIAAGTAPYRFVDSSRRARAAAAVARGIDVIVRSQIRQNGRLTAWCAQHDQQTLEPAWARAYEPPSLSGSETVGIVRFLMSVDKPTPQIVASIEGAVSWFRSVAMPGVRVDRVVRPDGRTERILVTDPNAPPLWARFYELGTNRPLYVDRDSVYRYDYSQISYERRSGYAYHSDTPALLLREDYPRWRARHALP